MVVLFDISGAFDSAWWPAILSKLQQWEVPRDIFGIISSFLEDRSVSLVVGSRESRIGINRGCPQGSVLGPLLWKALFDDLIVKVESSGHEATAYVDDLAVMVEGNSRAAIQSRTELMINEVQSWCAGVKMSVNESKTIGFVPKGSFDDRHPPRVKINGKWLNFPEEATYLGLTVTPRFSIAPHINSMSTKAVRVMNIMSRLCSDTWGLKFKVTKQIYDACFLGTVLYASGAWGHGLHGGQILALEKLQRNVLLRLTQAYRTISTDALQVLAGAPPIHLLIEKNVARSCLKRRDDLPLKSNQFFRTAIATLQNTNCVDKKLINEALDEAVINAWSERWEASSKGAVTKMFFPSIRSRLAKNFINLDHWMVQMLSGHGNYAAKLHFFKRKASPYCECGAVEDVLHVLSSCPLYDSERIKLFERVHSYDVQPAFLVEDKENFSAFQDFVQGWRRIKGGF